MTNNDNIFSVGDYIINFENIYKITDQKDQKDFSGKTRAYFYYQPVEDNHQTATYSTPVENISKSGFRRPISENIVKEIYQEAQTKIDNNTFLDFKSIKESLYQNNPIKSVVILKHLFAENQKTAQKFTKTNKDILEAILKHLVKEISFVSQEPSIKIEEKLAKYLQKAIQ